MPRLRVLNLSGGTPPRLRVLNVTGSGTAVAQPRVRVMRVSGSGTVTVRVLSIPTRTVEPAETVAVSALLEGGLTADSFMWRCITTPPVTITGAGATVTFESPSALPPGTSVTLGVAATIGADTSTEQTAVIDVLPQTDWSRVDGGAWVGPSPTAPPVPDDGYDVIVAMIQSNMRGAATDYVTADQYPAGVFMWDHLSSTIIPATEPQANWDNFNGMGGSNTFIKDYAAGRLAAGRKVLIVNTTRGGTGFTTPSSNSFGTGFHWRYDFDDDANNLARRAVDTITAAVAAAGGTSQVVAFLANHGSTDGTNNTSKATFKGYLQAWIPWLRGQLSAESAPYLMMQMRPDLIANETRHRNIADAQAETASELPNVGYALSPAGSTYYKADSVHFNAAGVRQIGHNLYAKYLELVP